MDASSSTAPGVRWWPVALVLAAAGLVLARIWIPEGDNRQVQVLASLLVLIVGVLLLLLWLLAFSRLRARLRLTAAVAVAAVIVLAAASVEIRDISGDLAPILAWRWSRPPAAPAASPMPGVVAVGGDTEAGPLAGAADFPQFLGPARNATVPGVILDPDWSARPPRERWRVPVGEGWSGFAVGGMRAITQEQRGDEEAVTCLDLGSGKTLWSYAYPAHFEDPLGGPGPRATPSIDDERVYALGGTGVLSVLDLADGSVVWSLNVIEEHGGGLPVYGVSASPLVIGERLFVLAGGSAGRTLVAYDARTGELLWTAGDDPAAYSSPSLVRLAGQEQVLLFTEDNVVSHDPASGEILWKQPWPWQTQRVSQPLVLPGDRVFVSTGYGVGGRLFRIRRGAGGWSSEQLWESRGLKAKFTNVVFRDGTIYGLDDGILVALDVESGERRWKRGRYGHGQLLLVDDLLLILSERGEVALVAASPDGYRELGRIVALDGKTWNHPALAGRYLLVRNGREAVCYELATAAGLD